MKKIYLFLATLCFTFFYSLLASGYYMEKNGIRYYLDNEGPNNETRPCKLISVYPWWDKNGNNYSHLSGDVYIEPTLYLTALMPIRDVEVIGYRAFAEMRPFVNITLPNTIKTIEDGAFKNATGLRKIYLNEGLTTLKANVFRGCYNLTSVNIPSTLKGIPNYTFEGCRSLSAINVAFVDTIGAHAFENCTALQSVSSSSTNFINFIWARRIGACAFSNCVNLQQIKFSGLLESIGAHAFSDCKKLEQIALPVNLKFIRDFAFSNSGLKTVTNYSSTPQQISSSVFEGVKLPLCILYVPKGCKDAYKNAPVWKEFGQIYEVGEIPVITGVHRSGDLYYDLHEDMTATLVKHEINSNHKGELTIPSSLSFESKGYEYTYTVTAMEEKVFQDCAQLTKVVLPNTITEIPGNAFNYCSALTSVTLPASLEKIGHYAFYESGLTSISLPPSVLSLDIGVFEGCAALTSVNLPAGITAIPDICFYRCTKLKSVRIPSSVTKISQAAFASCPSLSTVTIPSNVTSIGDYAYYGCYGLQSIKCERGTPIDLSDSKDVFDGVNLSTCILYVPRDSKGAYSNAAVWKDFANIRETGVNQKIKYGDLYYQLHEDFTAEVTYEKENDANNYKDLSSEVTVEDAIWYQGREYKVNAVGAYAFAKSKNITKVILPKIMDEINVHAFANSNLNEINIPGTLQHLSYTAFEGTPLFANNMDAQHTVYYDGCLLYHEPNYTSGTFTVKEGTRLIASFALSGAGADYSITELVLPEGLQCVCLGAIDYLQTLKTINIPSTVCFIQDYFLTKYCNDLQNIYCYSKEPIDLYGLSHAFSYWTKEELALISLYVPAGTRTAYQEADKWKDLTIVEMKPIYTVTFEDYDGLELKTEQVEQGKAAHAPEDPTREGYDFTGWDKDFTNVQSDLTVTAQYKKHIYTVLFVDGFTDGEIDTQYVEYGGRATEPEVPEHEGYAFIGWDKWFGFIRENTTVTAQYAELEGGGLVTTAFDPATGTLTYYFDPEYVERPGIVEVYHPDAIRFSDYRDLVLKAVIDPSMKDAQITSMKNLFYGNFDTGTFDINSLRKMTSIEGLENLNTAGVTDMSNMFGMCESLTELDLSSFDTKNVTNMNGMIGFCTKLKMVDVSSFDISKVTDMGGMFMGCQSLTTICCDKDWSFTNAKTLNMFFYCPALVGDKGTKYDSSVVDATYARPDGGTASPGYFTGETMTGINEELRIKNEELNEGAAIYNLAGQRMSKMQKGINIVSGKKVMK